MQGWSEKRGGAKLKVWALEEHGSSSDSMQMLTMAAALYGDSSFRRIGVGHALEASSRVRRLTSRNQKFLSLWTGDLI